MTGWIKPYTLFVNVVPRPEANRKTCFVKIMLFWSTCNKLKSGQTVAKQAFMLAQSCIASLIFGDVIVF